MEINYTIEDINNEEKLRQEEINKIYMKLLNMCYEDIKIANRQYSRNFTIFEVPNIIVGEPYFNQIDAIIFIINRLRKNGMYVRFKKPKFIFISWLNKDKVKQQENNEKRLLIEDLITNKTIQTNYTSVSNYPKGIMYHPSTNKKQIKYI